LGGFGTGNAVDGVIGSRQTARDGVGDDVIVFND
jgi:hypothetical protein